jgi:hypothetical protein
MTQAEKVIELLNAGPLDFITAKKHGISQLKTRICMLRKSGVKISHTMQPGVMATGKRIMYAIYTMDGQKYYRRGQKKKEHVKDREYTCAVGEVVYHNGRKMLVQEVLENGSEALKTMAFVKGCGFFQDGTPAERMDIFAGCDWDRQNDRQK